LRIPVLPTSKEITLSEITLICSIVHIYFCHLLSILRIPVLPTSKEITLSEITLICSIAHIFFVIFFRFCLFQCRQFQMKLLCLKLR